MAHLRVERRKTAASFRGSICSPNPTTTAGCWPYSRPCGRVDSWGTGFAAVAVPSGCAMMAVASAAGQPWTVSTSPAVPKWPLTRRTGELKLIAVLRSDSGLAGAVLGG